jgi:CheY-like chemotaxis protein
MAETDPVDEAISDSGGDSADVPVQARHVLLVEDEELVAMVMGDELKRLGWSVVGPAATLEEAQALVSSGVPIDVGVLDIHLRGRWVHGLAEELKQRGVPFVVCTGYEMVDPDGRFDGAPVIAKPFTAARLSAALDDLLRPSEPSPTPMQPDAG